MLRSIYLIYMWIIPSAAKIFGYLVAITIDHAVQIRTNSGSQWDTRSSEDLNYISLFRFTLHKYLIT